MQAIFYISRNTVRECLRQPIFVILLLVSLGIITAFPGMSMFVFGGQRKMVVDGSLATILLFGLITAVLCASHTVSREIDTGTVLLILSKPVSRPVFIIAKILGILCAITLFVWATSLCTLIVLKAATDQFFYDPYLVGASFGTIVLCSAYGGLRNYLAKKSFPAECAIAIGVGFGILAAIAYFMPQWNYGRYKWAEGSTGFDMNLARELVLILFAAWAMAAMATALSTRFNMMSNLTICLVLFVLGLMSDWFYNNILDMKLADLEHMMISWYYILFPVIIFFWVLTAKHFHNRRNTRIGLTEVHTVHGFLFLAVVLKTVVDYAAKAHLDRPAPWMRTVAAVLFRAKDATAEILYAVIPNWQKFWLADALAKNKTVPAIYIGMSGVYIALFILMFTTMAILMFSGREVGEQSLE